MSAGPRMFLEHLRAEGYHPRSDKHSNALAEGIVADLLEHCEPIARAAREGRLVYDLNFDLRAGSADWNVDLVLGAPQLGEPPSTPESGIARQPPASVEIAIELKAVMTEHRKAVRNRKRDLEAHHEHVHNYGRQVIAGGVLVINAAEKFRSPLRSDATTHKRPTALVEHCVDQLRSVATRGGATGYGLEAKCAVVVSHDNIDSAHTRFVSDRPAPTIGDPLHYDSFIRTICQLHRERFG